MFRGKHSEIAMKEYIWLRLREFGRQPIKINHKNIISINFHIRDWKYVVFSNDRLSVDNLIYRHNSIINNMFKIILIDKLLKFSFLSLASKIRRNSFCLLIIPFSFIRMHSISIQTNTFLGLKNWSWI